MNAFNLEGMNAPGSKHALEELHHTFATLSATEQKYAQLLITQIQQGRKIDEGKTFRDLITELQNKAETDQIHIIAQALGVDEALLRMLVNRKVTEANINEQNKFNELKESADDNCVKECMERLERKSLPLFLAKMKMDNLLRKFLFADDTEREDIARQIATEYIHQNPEFRDEMNVADPIINVSSTAEVHTTSVKMYSFQESEEPFLAMVADSSDIANLPEEARLEILRKSVIAVIALEDFKGKKLFTRKEQWEAIYRSAVDNYLSLEGDYAYFVTCLKRMNIADLPFPCTVELLEKNDVGVFQLPVEEWTVEQYHELNKSKSDKKYNDLLLVAERFKKIVLNHVPKVKVEVQATKDSSGVNIQIQDSIVTNEINAPVGNVIGNVENLTSNK